MGAPSNSIEAEYFRHHDNNRVIVEQWNGRIKEVFRIPSDHGYSGETYLLDDVVTFCEGDMKKA
jgi:hypothetical protein